MSPILSARGGMSAGAYGWGAAVSAGVASFESIATSTPTTGLSVTFSSIPSTFKHLQVRGIILQQSGASSFSGFVFNGDNANNYAEHYVYGGPASSGSNGVITYSQIDGDFVGGGVFPYPICFVLDILDYANTSKHKTTRLFLGQEVNAGGSTVQMNSGLWRSTSAINSIQFKGSGSVNFGTGTSFALYGIKEVA